MSTQTGKGQTGTLAQFDHSLSDINWTLNGRLRRVQPLIQRQRCHGKSEQGEELVGRLTHALHVENVLIRYASDFTKALELSMGV